MCITMTTIPHGPHVSFKILHILHNYTPYTPIIYVRFPTPIFPYQFTSAPWPRDWSRFMDRPSQNRFVPDSPSLWQVRRRCFSFWACRALVRDTLRHASARSIISTPPSLRLHRAYSVDCIYEIGARKYKGGFKFRWELELVLPAGRWLERRGKCLECQID